EPGDVAGREGPDAEQAELEHRLGHLALDRGECRQQQDAAGGQADDRRSGPAGGVAGVRLDAVGDGDQDGAQADGEGDVAPPVDPAGVPLTVVAQLAVGPEGPEDADGHVHPEHRPPGPSAQNTPRQSQAARSPPAIRPMNMPARPATWLMPSAKPRWSRGNASVRIAAEVDISMDPPRAWSNRQ